MSRHSIYHQVCFQQFETEQKMRNLLKYVLLFVKVLKMRCVVFEIDIVLKVCWIICLTLKAILMLVTNAKEFT